jgi:hypothetical protein
MPGAGFSTDLCGSFSDDLDRTSQGKIERIFLVKILTLTPCVNWIASVNALTMRSRRIRSSEVILHLGRPHHFVAKIAAEIVGRAHCDIPVRTLQTFERKRRQDR